MKHFHIFSIAFLALLLCACGGKDGKTSDQSAPAPEDNHFIGETEEDRNAADSLVFDTFKEAVASIAKDDDVIGVWSHDVGGETQYYYLIYRFENMCLLRNIYVEKKGYRLADKLQAIQLKRINTKEFSDLQNGGGYRLTDSTLVVYDVQNTAEILGKRVFDWKD